MSSWGAVFCFLVAFGGGMIILAGAAALFAWMLYKLDKLYNEEMRK